MAEPHTTTAGSIRSRVRAEMTEEIKAIARRHLAADGANLSLRAVRADAAVDQADLRGRWLSACHAIRRWALANPSEYALLYGTPVPDYKAPRDTTAAAIRTTAVFGRLLRDGVASGRLAARPGERLPRGVRADMRRLRGTEAFDVPEPVLARGMTGWVHVFGTVSFELFGRFNTVIEEREAFFDHQMRLIADVIGF